jgi:hypothetical protein
MDDSPSFKANQFANSADEYTRKGDYANACTAHFRAAEQFLLAMNDTKDAEVNSSRFELISIFHRLSRL